MRTGHCADAQGTLLPQLCVSELAASNPGFLSCDCIAHTYGNAADHGVRVRRYPSGLTDAEWAAIRPLLLVPAWLEGRVDSRRATAAASCLTRSATSLTTV